MDKALIAYRQHLGLALAICTIVLLVLFFAVPNDIMLSVATGVLIEYILEELWLQFFYISNEHRLMYNLALAGMGIKVLAGAILIVGACFLPGLIPVAICLTTMILWVGLFPARVKLILRRFGIS